jgi:hypothetical protein
MNLAYNQLEVVTIVVTKLKEQKIVTLMLGSSKKTCLKSKPNQEIVF